MKLLKEILFRLKICYVLLFTIKCNYSNQSIKQSSCSLEFERAILNLDTRLADEFDENIFCQGWEDGGKQEEFVFIVKGYSAFGDPCFYCDIINNGGKVEFTERSLEKESSFFIKEKSFEYYLGFNRRVCQKFNIPYPVPRCNDTSYFSANDLTVLLGRNINVKWDSLNAYIRLNRDSFFFRYGWCASRTSFF